MKETIYTILSSSFKNKKSWDYYNDSCDFGSELPFLTKELSVSFLKNFIKVSGKLSSNLLCEKIDGLKDYRAVHIVSAFFLGVYIYEKSTNNIKIKIDKELKKYQDKSKYQSNIQFAFVWFISCLFHDLGYEFEDDKIHKESCFNDFFVNNKLRKLNRVVGVPNLYKNIHKDYFNYRAKTNKNDHGICAAYILFTDLCKIRKEEEELKANNKLSWEKRLENVYNFASWIILSHNIWYANEKDKCAVERYKDEKLDELILKEKEFKVQLIKYPFLFLFSLVDTIEPLKRIKEIKSLDFINLEITTDKIIIESELNCGCNDVILNQAFSLNKWLTACEKKNNTVEINL